MPNRKPADGPKSLRQRAEDLLNATAGNRPPLSTREVQALVHELEVHRIELEMQNEELRQAQVKLAEERNRYSDLYEHAPVGYLTLNSEGRILEANLTAAALLGVERRELVRAGITKFVAHNSQDEYYRHRQALISGGAKHVCELLMSKGDGPPRVVRLESVASDDPEAGRRIRTALIDITEKRAGEDALQQLNIDLRHLVTEGFDALQHSVDHVRLLTEAITNLGEGVLITDDHQDWPGPHVLFVNEAFCRITGYSAEELVGHSPQRLLGDGADPATRARIRDELSARRSCRVDMVNRRKDGTRYETEIYITPLFDSRGQCTNFISIHRDVTERNLAEAERTRLAAIVETTSDAIISRDLDGRIESWNDGARRIFGYSENEVLGQSMSILVPPERMGEFTDIIERLHRGQRIEPFETVRRDKQGNRIDVSLTASSITDATGRIVGVSAIARDITDRKRVEDALKASEELRRTVLDTAADAIITIDDRGIVQSFNRAAETMFGYTAGEVIGQNVRILMPSPYREEHDEYLRRYQATGIRRLIGIGREVVGRRRDGTLFPLDLAVSEVKHLHTFTGILRDLTDRKQLEREILEIASLEQQRIGQDLHDSIGQQLTGLILLAQVLVDSIRSLSLSDPESDPTERAAALRQRSAQAERLRLGLEHALQEIRSISRELTPVPVDSLGLAAALQRLVEDVAGQSPATCSFHCPVPVAVADKVTAAHLYCIAQGALSNALRHAQPCEIQVRLEQTDNQLILSVRDNGIGMPSAAPAGLGLRIMQNRARIIGGMLVIRQVQPSGTEVACILPREMPRPG